MLEMDCKVHRNYNLMDERLSSMLVLILIPPLLPTALCSPPSYGTLVPGPLPYGVMMAGLTLTSSLTC